ncbi:SgcJ/EcaC family oxidoreductase [Plantibacter sp. Mn2098]|uniref:SgcJ/EcaC family oxidoreductase n=1 Tax=Plantibacter sp. Mn2098 TaxID=3395266 RepID=UPI003BD9431F
MGEQEQERERVVTQVLAAWARDIRAHDPEAVARSFTEDALFQGFDPAHGIGRPGIAAYYDKQPVGLDPRFEIRDHRTLADGVVIAYVDVDFVRPEGVVIPVHLTVVLVRDGAEWRIAHYHVSKIG